MRAYEQMIRESLAEWGRIGMDPRHVEAFMRVKYGTLDGLHPRGFSYAVRQAAEEVEIEGIEIAESLAESYGLVEASA